MSSSRASAGRSSGLRAAASSTSSSIAGSIGATRRRRCRHPAGHVLQGDLHRRVPGERLAAGEQLEQHDAGGVHVAAGVRDAALDLLGGEVGDGAEQQPGLAVRRAGVDGPGQAEVGHLDPAVVGDQHVLRLDVAVHDAGPVRGREGLEHRLQQVQRLARAHRAPLAHQVAQRAPGHVLHRQERHPVVRALVEDLDDAVVVEPGRRAASRVNRRTKSSSSTSAGLITLTATSRSSRSSSAR